VAAIGFSHTAAGATGDGGGSEATGLEPETAAQLQWRHLSVSLSQAAAPGVRAGTTQRLHEKGGKFHEMPCQHMLEVHLAE
jgi:hypothetical protein